MGAGRIIIGGCDERQLRSALELVLEPLPADQRGPLVESLARLADEPLGAFDALATATIDGHVVAAAWAQPQPGRTASLWLPQAAGVSLAGVSQPLIKEALRKVDAAGVEMTQTLLEPGDARDAELLIECGFGKLAELEYLGWSGDRAQPDECPDNARVDLTPVDFSDHRRLQRVVSSTYVETLDCPELDGMRSMADVLAGYQQTGDHDPALWFYLRAEGADVGALLLTEHRASKQLELMYMGIVPEARGQGFGKLAVQAAQKIARMRSADRLVLAVDARNDPAKRIYEQAGFESWATRVVYARSKPRD